METNNKKVVNKSYLEEQFYFYHKEYTIEKQNNILNKSDHILFTPETDEELSAYDLNIRIKDDSERQNYDILSCYKSDDDENTLQWVSTIYSNEDSNIDASFLETKDRALVTSHALRNFIGTDAITTTGNVISGDWESSIHTEAETSIKDLTVSTITIKDGLTIPAGASFSNEGTSTSESMEVNYLTTSVKATLKGNVAINTGSGLLAITSHSNDISIEGNVNISEYTDDGNTVKSNLNVSGSITAGKTLAITGTSTFEDKATFNNGVKVTNGLESDTITSTSLTTDTATVNDTLTADAATIASEEVSTSTINKLTIGNSLSIEGDDTSATIDTLTSNRVTVNEYVSAPSVKFTDEFTDGTTSIVGIVNTISESDEEVSSFLSSIVSDYTEE